MNKKTMEILACLWCKHFPLELIILSSKGEIISEGVIFCPKCSAWYPITEEIIHMLPEECRDKNQDMEFLKKYKNNLPDKIIGKGFPWHL